MSASQKELNTLRAKIATLADQRDQVGDAPIPRQEAETKFVHLIAGVRDDWKHGSMPAGLADGSVIERTLAEWLGRPAAMCALFGDTIRDSLLKHYDELTAGATPGLPATERRQRLTELDGQIYQLEQQEELLIEALEEQGVDVIRRPDASPHAALGLAMPGEAA